MKPVLIGDANPSCTCTSQCPGDLAYERGLILLFYLEGVPQFFAN